MDIFQMHIGEDFSTFDSENFLDPYPYEGTTTDSTQSFTPENYEWNSEKELEINGDIALVPVCDMNVTIDTSQNVDDFYKVLTDLQQLINVDPISDFTIEPLINSRDEAETDLIDEKVDILNTSNFDIAEYLNDDEPEPTPPVSTKSSSTTNNASKTNPSKPSSACRKFKAGVKKIDLQAQKYIIDEEEDEVDVETLSECEENSPVLEAKDVDSLFEQFEATQMHNYPEYFIKSERVISEKFPSDIFEEPSVKKIKEKKQETIVKKEIIEIEPNVKCELIETEQHKVKQELIEQQKVIPQDHEYGFEKRDNSNNQKRKRKRQKHSNEKEEETRENKKKKIISSIEIKEENAPVHPPQISSPKTDIEISQTVKNIPKLCSVTKMVSKPTEINQEKTQKLLETYPNSESSVTTRKPTQIVHIEQKPIHTVQKLNETAPRSPNVTVPNKQIADSLPPELIARIKESGKRKTISVIDPIPARKRGYPRPHDISNQQSKKKINNSVQTTVDAIHLDHTYCSVGLAQYPKNPKKDSGFESAEEDDRTVIGTQPTVKNADGKLMVSLLKVNTIHPNKVNSQKKKLNLEEYKKRREGVLIKSSSLNGSANSSASSSPMHEDETTRLLKHQEKLKRMAKEVLNAQAKGDKKPESVSMVIVPPQPVQVPVDMIKKTLVSIGVNTDFKSCSKNIDPLAPVERLDEIKPLLQKVSDKINVNSLITSVIENIPKVIDSCDQNRQVMTAIKDKSEHGEDKTIIYLPKNRETRKTCSVECQTNISLILQTKESRYRRRKESCSSTSSISSEDSRMSNGLPHRYDRTRISTDSRSSSISKSSRSYKSDYSTSSYSSRSSSRSLSPSSSPKYSRREKERLKEVEERRVIYVGRVASGTTKDDLRKRFQRFGPITNISLHSRNHSYLDNYGFVTFANKLDAYEAIEHGNDDPWQPKYDLSFGGRRIFCQTTYSDLDNMREESCGYYSRGSADDSFDKLLREAQEKMRKRKA
ncbi:uncharacterized protein LOC130900704 isoform X2 [Diorhabda carinulata]|uniref:uncharacterized protein LOC130900704 isoform X2 n=1 Tax=Diorhabda carinulata TaxID=1163345 RepID=UPI0025A0F8EF|nr:uncharacterized protein LOC130900704 isoform X2 [Diorhabda carinulata]